MSNTKMVYLIRELIEARFVCVIRIRNMSKRRVVSIFVQKELTAFVEYLKKSKVHYCSIFHKRKEKMKKDTIASSMQKKEKRKKS